MSDYILQEYTSMLKNDYILELLEKNPKAIIAGGVFKDILLKREPKDIDLFFRDQESMEEAFNKNAAKLENVNKNVNAITCAYTCDVIEEKKVYQLGNLWNVPDQPKILNIDYVKHRYGTPQEIIESFDFIVAHCAVYKENDKVYMLCHKDFKKHAKKKLAIISPTAKLEGTIERLNRYINHYSFTTDAQSIQRMLEYMIDAYPQDCEGLTAEAIIQRYKKPQEIFEAFEIVTERNVSSFFNNQIFERNVTRRIIQDHLYSYEGFVQLFQEEMEKFFHLTDMDYSKTTTFSSPYLASYKILKLYNKLLQDSDFQEFTEIMKYTFRPEMSEHFGTVTNIDSLDLKYSNLFNHYFFENDTQMDIVYKMLTLQDGKEWITSVLTFLSALRNINHYIDKTLRPNEVQWYDSMKNGIFDPEMNAELALEVISL